MEWILLLQLTLLTPMYGSAIVSSEEKFPTLISCESHLVQMKPFLDGMIKHLFGPNSTYREESLTCKEVLKGNPV